MQDANDMTKAIDFFTEFFCKKNDGFYDSEPEYTVAGNDRHSFKPTESFFADNYLSPRLSH